VLESHIQVKSVFCASSTVPADPEPPEGSVGVGLKPIWQTQAASPEGTPSMRAIGSQVLNDVPKVLYGLCLTVSQRLLFLRAWFGLADEKT